MCVQALARGRVAFLTLRFIYHAKYTLVHFKWADIWVQHSSFNKMIFYFYVSLYFRMSLSSQIFLNCMIFEYDFWWGRRSGENVSTSDHIHTMIHSWQVVPSGMHSSIRWIICHSESFDLWKGQNHLWKDILQLMIQEVWGRLFFEGYKGHSLRRNNWVLALLLSNRDWKLQKSLRSKTWLTTIRYEK